MYPPCLPGPSTKVEGREFHFLDKYRQPQAREDLAHADLTGSAASANFLSKSNARAAERGGYIAARGTPRVEEPGRLGAQEVVEELHIPEVSVQTARELYGNTLRIFDFRMTIRLAPGPSHAQLDQSTVMAGIKNTGH